MTDNKACSMCGVCCRVLPLVIKNLSKEYLAFLRYRGLKEEQGFILIPQDCQHLINNRCDVHESPDRPKICSSFHGQKRIGMMSIYIPSCCTYQR